VRSRTRGIQLKLNTLAARREFQEILRDEVEKHKLVLPDVQRGIKMIYHELSKHAHGNIGAVKLEERHFRPGELAILISFFRLQDGWGNPIEWREALKPKEKICLVANGAG